MKLSGFLNFGGISGQIAALVIASIAAIHLIITASFLINRPDRPDPSNERGDARLAAAVQLLGTAAASDRPRLLADIARAFPTLEIEDLRQGAAVAVQEPESRELRHLQRRLGDSYRVFPLAHEAGFHKAAIVLPDGATIAAKILPERQPPFWGGPWMMTLLFVVVSVALLGLWAARTLTAPLSSFARAAENFSLNGTAAPLPERGPEEIRSVARALKFGGARAQPDAGTDHRADGGPHQNAGSDQPRFANADHPDAAALRIHRGRHPSRPHARRSRPDAIDAGIRAVVPAQ